MFNTFRTTTTTNCKLSLNDLMDEVINEIQSVAQADSATGTGYPKYNIRRVEKDSQDVILEIAVPGFKKGDIEVSVKDNTLTIIGDIKEKPEQELYFVKQFSNRKFNISFKLHNSKIDAKQLTLSDGVLSIYLNSTVPPSEKYEII